MMRASARERFASSVDVCIVWVELVSVSFAAWVVLAIATLTCSTAVVCCWVLSSIARTDSVVVATSPEM